MAEVPKHDDIPMQAGQPFLLEGTVTGLDSEGNEQALDLTGAELEWVLIGPDGQPVEHLATVEAKSPPTDGIVQIEINPAHFATFKPGRYYNALRVIRDDVPDTVWEGIIKVGATPFFGDLE